MYDESIIEKPSLYVITHRSQLFLLLVFLFLHFSDVSVLPGTLGEFHRSLPQIFTILFAKSFGTFERIKKTKKSIPYIEWKME